MGYIKINHDKITPQVVKELEAVCPFNAFDYIDSYLSINAACKVCKLCVKKGPLGACEFIEEEQVTIDRTKYKGITVYIEQFQNKAHPVAWELIGKARELARITNEPVYALVVGSHPEPIIEEALSYGVDKVFVYQDKSYEMFNVDRSTAIVEDFYHNH